MSTEKLQAELRRLGPEANELAAKLETKEIAEACDRLVQNDVFFNMSAWLDYALRRHANGEGISDSPIDPEDIPLDEDCSECDGSGYLDEECEKACNECDDGRIMIEIFEWWAVSKYLGRKLAELGEVVLEGEYWGRQTTGQGIAQDSIIETVIREQRAFVSNLSK